MTVEGLLVDIEGVLAVSWEPVPGAAAALAELRSRGLPVRFVTNTTSRTRAEVVERLVGAGLDVAVDEVLTAPAATAAHLRAHHPGARCLLINEGDLVEDLAGVEVVGSPPADVVVLGGAGPAYTHDRLTAALRLVLDGAPLVAMHRNLTWRTPEGFELDTGAYLVGLEAAAGVEATVLGKPSPDFFAAALADLGVPAGRAAMVGDDVETDVLAAQQVGVTGVLVRTGKFRPELLAAASPAPDHVVDSVADVPALLSG